MLPAYTLDMQVPTGIPPGASQISDLHGKETVPVPEGPIRSGSHQGVLAAALVLVLPGQFSPAPKAKGGESGGAIYK